MAEIWSGDILLADNTVIKDVSLASPNVASNPTISTAAIHFLSTVVTARIPLYLAAGPSLDVWTTSIHTEQWFQSLLLSKALLETDASTYAPGQEWWTCARAQSPIGILAQVENSVDDGEGPRITEILFYGTVAAPLKGSLPTPPSSSPDLPHTRPGDLLELRVHALPLSCDLLHHSNVPDLPPLSPALSATETYLDREPQFLTSAFPLPPATTDSPKRKRDVFDEAEQLRKKAKRKGGEGVSAAAAAKAGDSQRAFAHRKSLSVDTKATPIADVRPASANAVLKRPPSRQLSRSPSISSDIRPLSRKGLSDGQPKRSTLSTVESISLGPEEPTVESRNKEALSRVVMAAMRMYGLQQRKKTKSRRGSMAPNIDVAEQLSEEAAAEVAAKDEEYKLIYHQTYKGAALALVKRKHISSEPLHLYPDKLRDVVEKLLAIFCTDPLDEPPPAEEPQNFIATPASQVARTQGTTYGQINPFDKPSINRLAAVNSVQQEQMLSGSPVSKRKAGNP